MTIGDRIRHRRHVLGLSQQDLADKAGLAQNAVSRIERGGILNPGADMLKRLALALHCSVDWLLAMYDDDGDPTDALSATAP